jgi:hypothetical protein
VGQGRDSHASRSGAPRVTSPRRQASAPVVDLDLGSQPARWNGTLSRGPREKEPALRGRIEGDTLLGPSAFRLDYLEPYAEAARTWLHGEAEVVDTTHLTPSQAALQIAQAVVKTEAWPRPAAEWSGLRA